MKRFSDLRGISFPLLSDPDSAVIKSYGLLNTEAKGKAVGVPHPATIVVDREGVVRAMLNRDGYRERHTTEELLDALKKVK